MRKCELDGSTQGLIEFQMPLPPVGLLQAFVCLECWSQAASDFAVAVAILQRRAAAAGIQLPIEDLVTFAQLVQSSPETEAE